MARVRLRSRRTIVSGVTIGRSCSLRTTSVWGGFANDSPDRGDRLPTRPEIPRREQAAIGPSRAARIAGTVASRIRRASDCQRPTTTRESRRAPPCPGGSSSIIELLATRKTSASGAVSPQRRSRRAVTRRPRYAQHPGPPQGSPPRSRTTARPAPPAWRCSDRPTVLRPCWQSRRTSKSIAPACRAGGTVRRCLSPCCVVATETVYPRTRSDQSSQPGVL